MAEQRTAWFATRNRKHGPARAGLETLVDGREDLNPVLVEVARSTADLVDTAKRRQDPRQWLSASARLMSVMDRLGLTGEHHGDVADSGEPGGVSLLAGVVGGPPEVRDVATSRATDVRAADSAGS